jgi:hypothetical protein
MLPFLVLVLYLQQRQIGLMSNADAASMSSRPKTLNVALWVVQGLLAASYGMAGVMKTTMPIAALAGKLVWPGIVPAGLVRFIGAAELAGALGLILPSVTRVRPALTPIAAAGLTLIMLLATAFHVSRGEIQAVPVSVTLGALAAFVAWGRSKKARISPR